jgi:hypothetical protein
MSMQPEDTGDLPVQVTQLYDRPESQWGPDEWRTLALYFFDELQASHKRFEEVFDMLQDSHRREAQVAQCSEDSMRQVRRVAYAKVGRLIDRALESGTLILREKQVRKLPGAPKKYTDSQLDVQRSASLVWAARYGPTQAAKRMAAWQLKKEGINPALNQTKLDRYTKTWANKISNFRASARKQIWEEHGSGLAAIDQLMKLGLHSPNKGRRKVRRSPNKS